MKQPFALPHTQLCVYLSLSPSSSLSFSLSFSLCVSLPGFGAHLTHSWGCLLYAFCLCSFSFLLFCSFFFPTFCRHRFLSASPSLSLSLALSGLPYSQRVGGVLSISLSLFLSIAKCRMCFQVFSLQLPNPNDKSHELLLPTAAAGPFYHLSYSTSFSFSFSFSYSYCFCAYHALNYVACREGRSGYTPYHMCPMICDRNEMHKFLKLYRAVENEMMYGNSSTIYKFYYTSNTYKYCNQIC